jgi:hypothetical protein
MLARTRNDMVRNVLGSLRAKMPERQPAPETAEGDALVAIPPLASRPGLRQKAMPPKSKLGSALTSFYDEDEASVEAATSSMR